MPKRKNGRALSDRQLLFAQEYLVDLNATQAAIRAGYSKKSARHSGSSNITNPDIARIIQKGQTRVALRAEIKAADVLRELAKIGFSNMTNYIRVTADGDPFIDLSQLTEDQAAAISAVTCEDFTEGRGEDARNVRKVTFKLSDKRAALVDIGKHLGMFVERVQQEVSVSSVKMEFVKGKGKPDG